MTDTDVTGGADTAGDTPGTMNLRPGLVASAVGLTVMAAISLWAAPRVGTRVPLHFDLSGQPEGFGPAWQGLLLTPGITVVLAVVFWLLPRIDPRREHLARSARAYNALWIAMIGVLLIVHLTILVPAASAVDLPTVSLSGVIVGAALVVVGNYLPKISSNWFLGIRTPWTLSSERSWRLTHRLGGRLYLAVGVVILLVTFVWTSALPWAVIGGVGAATLITLGYSYVAWRDDPDREATGAA